MKFLPAKLRELQSDAFAKVGLSWAADVVQFCVPEDPNDPYFPWNLAEKRFDLQPGAILTVFFIACSNDSNQNAWGVFSINSAFKAEIKKLSPFTTESVMVTDGAAYYSCTQTALLHRALADATGIRVILKIHTVAGHGKGGADAFISAEKRHLVDHVDTGGVVGTATDMVNVLSLAPRSHKAMHVLVQIDREAERKVGAATAVPNFAQYHEVVYNVDGSWTLRLFPGFGDGRQQTVTEVNSLWQEEETRKNALQLYSRAVSTYAPAVVGAGRSWFAKVARSSNWVQARQDHSAEALQKQIARREKESEKRFADSCLIDSLVGPSGDVRVVLQSGHVGNQDMFEAATQVDLSITRFGGPIVAVPCAEPERVVSVRPYSSVLHDGATIRAESPVSTAVPKSIESDRPEGASGRTALKVTAVGKQRPERFERPVVQEDLSADVGGATPNWDSEESDGDDDSDYDDLSEIDPDSDQDDTDEYDDLGDDVMPDGGPLLPQSSFSDFPEGYARHPPRISNPPWPAEVLDFMIARFHTQKRTLLVQNVEKEFTDEFRTHHQITTQRIVTWVSSYGKSLKAQVKKAVTASSMSAEVSVEAPVNDADSKNGKRSAVVHVLGGEDQAETHVRKKK
jgi:nucleotide-binding universal stress UspA family protein